MAYAGIINKYLRYLPLSKEVNPITLLEGNTPLIEADNLRAELKSPAKIFLKFEGTNPTGSFKDRGMTVAITKAVEDKAESVVCASTGNTSASAAAYAAKAGLKAFVILPKGKIAIGKLAQALIYGAEVVEIDGNFDDALRLVREIGEKTKVVIVNSINPFRIEGQKTASFEIIETLGKAPTHHSLPVGNAGNITAYWKGYKEWSQANQTGLPKMLGFQAEGAAPIVYGRIVEHPETIATAIRIGNPASWKQAVQALDESSGQINIVSDPEILFAQKLVASTEGIFCEPASASSVAGLKKLIGKNYFSEKDVVVCTLTGNGLKDPDTASRDIAPPLQAKPDLSELLNLIQN
jgi:threonine synthase